MPELSPVKNERQHEIRSSVNGETLVDTVATVTGSCCPPGWAATTDAGTGTWPGGAAAAELAAASAAATIVAMRTLRTRGASFRIGPPPPPRRQQPGTVDGSTRRRKM